MKTGEKEKYQQEINSPQESLGEGEDYKPLSTFVLKSMKLEIKLSLLINKFLR